MRRGGGNSHCGDSCAYHHGLFKLGTACPKPEWHRESVCTIVLAGCWGGGTVDRNVTISKAVPPSSGLGGLPKALEHPQGPSWDGDLHLNPVFRPRV